MAGDRATAGGLCVQAVCGGLSGLAAQFNDESALEVCIHVMRYTNRRLYFFTVLFYLTLTVTLTVSLTVSCHCWKLLKMAAVRNGAGRHLCMSGLFVQEMIIYAIWTLFYFIALIISAVVAGQSSYYFPETGAAAVSVFSRPSRFSHRMKNCDLWF